MFKPSLVKIIGERVELRRVGRQWRGLCPFHAEKTPSFYVNDEKGRFHCFGCGESGDVFDFIMKLDRLSFSDACKSVGIDNSSKRQSPKLTPGRQRAALLAAAWINQQRAKFNVMLANALEQRDLADESGAFELAEIFDRELTMLRGFYESLSYADGAVELLASRPAIEAITNGTAVKL